MMNLFVVVHIVNEQIIWQFDILQQVSTNITFISNFQNSYKIYCSSQIWIVIGYNKLFKDVIAMKSIKCVSLIFIVPPSHSLCQYLFLNVSKIIIHQKATHYKIIMSLKLMSFNKTYRKHDKKKNVIGFKTFKKPLKSKNNCKNPKALS